MSKLIKSAVLVESIPCLLNPPAPDAFLAEAILAEVADDCESLDDTDHDLLAENTAQQVELLLRQTEEESRRIVAEAEERSREMLEKAQQEAEELSRQSREEANQEADRILNLAREEAVQLKNQAQLEGMTEGTAQGRQEWEERIMTAARLAVEVENGRLERIARSEPELLELAVAIAQKIIGAELELDPSQQLALVRNALARMNGASNITIRIHPEDRELIDSHLPQLREVFTEPKPIRIEDDPAIAPGGCYIETERGSADARVQSQLEAIADELLKVVRT